MSERSAAVRAQLEGVVCYSSESTRMLSLWAPACDVMWHVTDRVKVTEEHHAFIDSDHITAEMSRT